LTDLVLGAGKHDRCVVGVEYVLRDCRDKEQDWARSTSDRDGRSQLASPHRPLGREGSRVFRFKLELASGEPADPPRFETSEPNWRPGHVIFFGPQRPALRVVGAYAGASAHGEITLIVEPDE
jgi:hypothetical protein